MKASMKSRCYGVVKPHIMLFDGFWWVFDRSYGAWHRCGNFADARWFALGRALERNQEHAA